MAGEEFEGRFFWLMPSHLHHKQGLVPVIKVFCYWCQSSLSLPSFWFPGFPCLWCSQFITTCPLRLQNPHTTFLLGACSLLIAGGSPGHTPFPLWSVPSSELHSTPPNPYLPSIAQDLPSFQAPVELSNARPAACFIVSFSKRSLETAISCIPYH